VPEDPKSIVSAWAPNEAVIRQTANIKADFIICLEFTG
jgi:hypothetical protein